MTHLPSGIVTFLFTDIEGSTRLWERDADVMWARIDSGLGEAAARSITRRYVWALPQVNRDGYTRLAPPPEQAMDPFDNVLYPFALGRSASVVPEFSTSIAVTCFFRSGTTPT